MKRIIDRESDWLNSIYGQPLILWECYLVLKNNLSNRSNANSKGKIFEFEYLYEKQKTVNGEVIIT